MEDEKLSVAKFEALVNEIKGDCDKCKMDCRYRLQWLDSLAESLRHQLAKALAMNRVLLKAANLVADDDYLDREIKRLTARILKEEAKNRDHKMTAKKKTSAKNSPVGIDEILKAEIKEGPPILINGILPAGGGMILGGESEVGKSLMRVEWSVLLAGGLPVYGMKTPHAETVLVFQTENTLKVEQFRTKKIMQGYGIESCHNRIFYARSYRKPSLLSGEFLDHAEQQIRDSGATVVWWDPLVSFHNRKENDNVAMRNVLDAITYLNRKTGAASIIIHHFGQPATNRKDEIPLRYRLRGASAIRDWADTIVTLRHTGKPDNPGPGRMVDYIKIRNGPQRRPVYLERDSNFVHHVTSDQRKASPLFIADLIKRHGDRNGYLGSQNELCRLIQDEADCIRKLAQDGIKEALTVGYINEKLVDGVKYWNARMQGG